MHDTSRSYQVQDCDQQYSDRGKLSHAASGPAIFQPPRQYLELRYHLNLDNPPPEQGQQLLQVNTLIHSTSFVCPLYSLVDHLLPDMDGFEVCRRIRADPASAHIPVVMLTGLLDDASRVKGLEAGADDYLTKPFHIIELMASIRSLLQYKRPRGSAARTPRSGLSRSRRRRSWPSARPARGRPASACG